MTKWWVWGLGGVVALAVALPLLSMLYAAVRNPSVERELMDDPQGETAQKVMLIGLPSGRRLPVNYLQEDGRLYAGADGRWWRELEAGPRVVQVLVRGETFEGRARAVLDDPDYTKDVFSRLRPTAVPGFGTLVEILIDPNDEPGPAKR